MQDVAVCGCIALPRAVGSANEEEFVEKGYRVHGDCVFFPGPSRPTEKLQHQPDTGSPNVHPASILADQVRMEARRSVQQENTEASLLAFSRGGEVPTGCPHCS